MADEVRYIERPPANLSGLLSSVDGLSGQIGNIDTEIDSVKGEVQSVRGKLDDFANEFRQFVESDLKARRLQMAEQDILEVQQEIEKRFTGHQHVRKYVTGILQASDIAVVRNETLKNCTEALMLDVPQYWLVPCLIALAAWLNDNRSLAERAIKEALTRDDEKASLLFALICRRVRRDQAAAIWLERFFHMQDPMAMQHKVLVMLDAYSTGLFGGDAKGICAQHIYNWITELEETVGFRERQVEHWKRVICLKIPKLDYSEYPYLSRHAENWQTIQDSINASHLHEKMQEYLQSVLDAPEGGTRRLNHELDRLLDALVENYDVEELPVRRRKQHLEFIIQARGDWGQADRAMEAAAASFDELVDFSQLITNAATQPEQVGASAATQKLALALARDWAMEAYGQVVVANREKTPQFIELNLDGWKGETENGDNEEELIQSARDYLDERCGESVQAIRQPKSDYIWLGGGAALCLLGIAGAIPWLLGVLSLAVGCVKFYLGYRKKEKSIDQTKQNFNDRKERAGQIVRACCAETVDFRNVIHDYETQYPAVMNYLRRISPHQFIARTARDQTNVVMQPSA